MSYFLQFEKSDQKWNEKNPLMFKTNPKNAVLGWKWGGGHDNLVTDKKGKKYKRRFYICMFIFPLSLPLTQSSINSLDEGK